MWEIPLHFFCFRMTFLIFQTLGTHCILLRYNFMSPHLSSPIFSVLCRAMLRYTMLLDQQGAEVDFFVIHQTVKGKLCDRAVNLQILPPGSVSALSFHKEKRNFLLFYSFFFCNLSHCKQLHCFHTIAHVAMVSAKTQMIQK